MDLHFIQLSKTEKPNFNERKNRDWVSAGKENKLFDDLIDYSTSYSSTHTSILKTKIDLMKGSSIINKGYIELDILEDLIEKCISDYVIVGGAFIEIVKNRNFFTYNHIPIQNLRFSKANSRNIIEGVYYSRDWSNLRLNQPVFIPFYDKNSKEPRQIYLIRNYWPGSQYQIIPDYYSALNWINIDKLISEFHLNTLEQGMNPGLIIQFFSGNLEQTQKDKIISDIQEKYSGASSASKVMVLFNKNKENMTEINQLESSSHHEMFITLNDMVLQQILTAHRISPLLAGVQTSGKLGGGTEYIDSFKIYMNNVIKPSQNFISKKINNILNLSNNSFEINNEESLIYNFSENILKDILDINEMRKMAGFNVIIEKNQ